MAIDRRRFIRHAGLWATGVAWAGTACRGNGNEGGKASSTEGLQGEGRQDAGIGPFGIQLYTLRDDMPKDPKGVITRLAGFGYRQMEGFEGPQGMFWGMSHMDFKRFLDDLGVEMVSSHCDMDKDFEAKAAQAAEVGMKYLICPWIGPQKTADDYKRFADTFNSRGEVCRRNGLRFAYHNHAYSFLPVEGQQLPQDILMTRSDPATVDFEMDIYWVVTAGADPEAWLGKHPGRFTLCHVKDRMKGAGPKEEDASCDLGKGSIDYARILKATKEGGMRYHIVEQERYDGSTPMESARACAAYMKGLKL